MERSSTPKLKDRLQKLGLSTEDIKRHCTNRHAAEVAKKLAEWKDICPCQGFDISPDEIIVIERNNTNDEEAKRKACLDKWMSKKGVNATYEVLLESLFFIGRVDLADELLQLIKEAYKDDGLESDADVKKEDMRFLCGCGKCSLDNFIKHGCPNPWEKSRFPLINIKHMNVKTRLELLGRLTEESEKVTEKFGSIVTKLNRSLKSSGVIDADDLVLFLLPQQKFTYLEEEKRLELQRKLREAQSIGDVMKLLTENFISWFNHPLLGTISKEFLPTDTSYQNYVKNVFLPFIQKSLFEIPATLSSKGELVGSGKFIVKVDVPQPKSSVKGEIMLPLRRHLSKNLGIAINSFEICSYDKGCLRFNVAAPLLLLQTIFPLSDNVINLLSDFCFKGAQLKSVLFEQYHHAVPKKDIKRQESFDCFSVAKTRLSKIMNDFASLVRSIKDISIPKVKTFLCNVFIFKLRKCHQKLINEESIGKVSTVFDLVLLLNSYWSFYNYSLLATIIRMFGSSTANKRLSEYIKNLDILPIAEFPSLIQPFVYNDSYDTENVLMVKLKLKNDDILSLSGDTVREIHNCVACQLDFEFHALLLKQIHKGTNEMEFLVPRCSVDLSSYNITHEQIHSISYKGETVNCCLLKAQSHLFDKESGIGSSFMSSDDTTSPPKKKYSKKLKVQTVTRTISNDSTLSEEENEDTLPRLKPIHRLTSIIPSSDQDTIIPEKLSPPDPSFIRLLSIQNPTVDPSLDLNQQSFSQMQHDSMPQVVVTLPPKPLLLPSYSASLVPSHVQYIIPEEIFKYEDHSQSFKRSKAFQEVKEWKTTFQSRFEQTVLREEEVEADLTIKNYKDKFYCLLCYEESACITQLTERCDGDYELKLFGHKISDSQQAAYITGMSNDQIQYATQTSEAVFILDKTTREEICKADIFHSNFHSFDENFFIILSASALHSLDQKLNIKKEKKAKVYAEFEVKHDYFDTLHKALVNIPHSMIRKLMPLTSPVALINEKHENIISDGPISELNIDDKQLQALELILQSSQDVPLIISGPFGSGKTRLLARAAYELLERGSTSEQYCTKILVCAHHESTLDKMTEMLDCAFKNKRGVKIIKISRGSRRFSAANIVQSCSIDSFSEDIKQGKHIKDRIILIITTYTLSVQITDILAPKLFRFTHTLLDEAAQVREPEAIAALSLGDASTKVVIAGDSKQVGPFVTVVGDIARENGLKTSLLERLDKKYDEIERITNHFVHLNANYRCHPALTQFLATTVYKYPIEPATSIEPPDLHPKASVCPCFFHCSHIKPNTPSTEEEVMAEEAKVIVEQMKELRELWPDHYSKIRDTFVVSSSRSQLNLIRKEMLQAGIYENENLSLKTSYTIQGHECHTVFISTFEPLEDNGQSKNPIKTLVQPEIFNTVLSRSKQLVIAVGNPFTLLNTERAMGSNPECWKEYLKFCFKNNTITYAKEIEIENQKKLEVILSADLGISSQQVNSAQMHEPAPTHSLSYQPKREKKKSKNKKRSKLSAEEKIKKEENVTINNNNDVRQEKYIKSDQVQNKQEIQKKKMSEIPSIAHSAVTITKQKVETTKQLVSSVPTSKTIGSESETVKTPKQSAGLQSSKQTLLLPTEEKAKTPKHHDTFTQREHLKQHMTTVRTSCHHKTEEHILVSKQPLHSTSYHQYRKPKEQHIDKGIIFEDRKKKGGKHTKKPRKILTLDEFHSQFDLDLPLKDKTTKNEIKKPSSFTSPEISYASALRGKSL